MMGPNLRRLAILAFTAFFLSGQCDRELPPSPGPEPSEDPITKVLTPGAYGVKGGDKILLPSSQTGVLTYGNSFTFRILEPSTLTVISLSGLPVQLKVGDRISLHYRLAKGGRTLESEVYENVEILLTNDKMAWLKKNDQIFFVIQLL